MFRKLQLKALGLLTAIAVVAVLAPSSAFANGPTAFRSASASKHSVQKVVSANSINSSNPFAQVLLNPQPLPPRGTSDYANRLNRVLIHPEPKRIVNGRCVPFAQQRIFP